LTQDPHDPGGAAMTRLLSTKSSDRSFFRVDDEMATSGGEL